MAKAKAATKPKASSIVVHERVKQDVDPDAWRSQGKYGRIVAVRYAQNSDISTRSEQDITAFKYYDDEVATQEELIAHLSSEPETAYVRNGNYVSYVYPIQADGKEFIVTDLNSSYPENKLTSLEEF